MVLFLLALLILIVLFFGAFIMASFQEATDLTASIKTSIAAVDSKVDGIATLVAALRAEIAAGGGLVTQAELDAHVVELSAIKSGLAAVDAKLTTIA